MPYHLLAVPKFNRVKKKLPAILRAKIDEQVRAISVNPSIGTSKVGDLSGVRVHKFNCMGQLYLLAYAVDEEAKTVCLLAVGGHENFYRDLKKYLKG